MAQLAVLVVHTHLTLQNCVGAICRGLPTYPAVCSAARAVTIPALLVGALVLRRYRYRPLVDIDAGGRGTRLAARAAYALAHHSLAVYVGHIGALIALDRWRRGGA